ncbi:hypothetical protein Tcan_01939 [Toxocara canis]|uniref:Uncharacterized protein n=1 Tax=Toxocara canis TaxID=6265 RepID=A0A0B2VY40_TOXCA|nr:hypothetical protein Tcan_01939 [Toxocara canis]
MKFLTGLRAVLLVLLSASSADPDHFDNPIDDRTNVGARYIAVDIKKDLIRRPEHKKSQVSYFMI